MYRQSIPRRFPTCHINQTRLAGTIPRRRERISVVAVEEPARFNVLPDDCPTGAIADVCIAAGLLRSIPPITCGLATRPRRIFPLGLGRQAVRPRGFPAEPFSVGHRVLLAHADYRMPVGLLISWVVPSKTRSLGMLPLACVVRLIYPNLTRHAATSIIDEHCKLTARDRIPTQPERCGQRHAAYWPSVRVHLFPHAGFLPPERRAGSYRQGSKPSLETQRRHARRSRRVDQTSSRSSGAGSAFAHFSWTHCYLTAWHDRQTCPHLSRPPHHQGEVRMSRWDGGCSSD